MTDKEKWIINYISSKRTLRSVNMLDEDFVNAFLEEFEVKFDDMTLGSVKCKELSKLLSSMYKKKILKRFPCGVRGGLYQDGKFPKWVYLYELEGDVKNNY